MTDIARRQGRSRTRTGPRRDARRTSATCSASNPVTAFAFAPVRADRAGGAARASSFPTIRWPATRPSALKPPSAAHWFGTDQLGRDIFSRVIVATRLDLSIAVSSVALVFVMGGLAGVAAGFFGGWTDRIVVAHRRHHHGLPAVRAGHGHRRGARQHGGEHRHRHRDHQLPALCPRRPRRGQRAARGRLRAGGAALRQRRAAHPARATSSPTSCRS